MDNNENLNIINSTNRSSHNVFFGVLGSLIILGICGYFVYSGKFNLGFFKTEKNTPVYTVNEKLLLMYLPGFPIGQIMKKDIDASTTPPQVGPGHYFIIASASGVVDNYTAVKNYLQSEGWTFSEEDTGKWFQKSINGSKNGKEIVVRISSPFLSATNVSSTTMKSFVDRGDIGPVTVYIQINY